MVRRIVGKEIRFRMAKTAVRGYFDIVMFGKNKEKNHEDDRQI